MTWKNRIVSYGEEVPDQLLANPGNWRVHPKFQQDALGAILDEVGWVQDVIVNKTTGYVVDGHLRVAMAISRGEPTVPVKYVELSEEEEAKVLATLDPLSTLAIADADILSELLVKVDTESDAVQIMLDETLAGAELDGWLSDQLEEAESKADMGRRLGNRKVQIKPVLYAEDIATFERAILLAGNPNRGDALIGICSFYLQAHDHAKE